MSPGTSTSETKTSVVSAVYIDGDAVAVTCANVNDGSVGFQKFTIKTANTGKSR